MLRPFKALVSSEDGSTVLTSFQNLFSTTKFVNHIAQLAKRLQAALIVCPDSSVPKRADGEQDAKTDSGMWVSCHVGSAGLPMEHPYREPEIYVRPCYPYFYDLIKGSLYEDDEQGVTVSGTPGIGKSVFFAYFLVRYSEMNPGTTVITIPSGREGKHSVMEKLVVWRGGKIVGMAKKIKSRMFKLIEKSEREAEKRNEQVIQLYDGAPKVSPKEAKFVCFTSPCEPWFDHIRKFSYYSTFYMPLWALDELQTAARALNLPIRAPIHGTGTVLKDVERRFNIFGGTARECLSTSAKFVTRRKLEIEAMIDKFDSLKPSVIGHYAPIHNDPTRYEIVASSKYIQRLLIESLTTLRIEQREEVNCSLEIRSSAAVYRGALFEMAMHDQLSAGCTFAARRLGGDTIETFACERSGPTHSCYFDSDFSSSLLSTGPYHIPRARNFAAIDSFYYSTAHSAKPKLWLFQSTVAPSHPVSGEGVLELLEGLESVGDGDCRAGPSRADLRCAGEKCPRVWSTEDRPERE